MEYLRELGNRETYSPRVLPVATVAPYFDENREFIIGRPLVKRTPLQKGILAFGGLVFLALASGVIALAAGIEENRESYTFPVKK